MCPCVEAEQDTTSCKTEGTSGDWEGRWGHSQPLLRTSCTAQWRHCSRPLYSSLGLVSTCNDGNKKKKLRENNLIAIRIWLSHWSFYPSLHKVSLTFSLVFWFIIYILCTCSTLMSHVNNVHMKFGVRIIDA